MLEYVLSNYKNKDIIKFGTFQNSVHLKKLIILRFFVIINEQNTFI